LLDGNVLTPRLQGTALSVHPVVVLVAVIVAGQLFGLGGVLVTMPILAALHLTGDDAVDPALALPLTSLLVLCAAAPAGVPLGIYLAVPRQSAALLGALRDWIGRASQAAVDVVLAALGAWLILRGLSGLLG
ncbi:MAG TPA: AI-2E family transporter, partial [Chloroflexota bacterium]|nr:AI-2E family transporter [Chloroflexota bacterium]